MKSEKDLSYLLEKHAKQLTVITSIYQKSLDSDTKSLTEGAAFLLDMVEKLLENVDVNTKKFFLNYVTVTIPYLFKEDKATFNMLTQNLVEKNK